MQRSPFNIFMLSILKSSIRHSKVDLCLHHSKLNRWHENYLIWKILHDNTWSQHPGCNVTSKLRIYIYIYTSCFPATRPLSRSRSNPPFLLLCALKLIVMRRVVCQSWWWICLWVERADFPWVVFLHLSLSYSFSFSFSPSLCIRPSNQDNLSALTSPSSLFHPCRALHPSDIRILFQPIPSCRGHWPLDYTKGHADTIEILIFLWTMFRVFAPMKPFNHAQ